MTGRIFAIKKGIPPINLYIKKKKNSFFSIFNFKYENLAPYLFLIISFKKKFANKYNIVAPTLSDTATTKVPIHLPKIKPEIRATGLPKPSNKTQKTVNKKNINIV